VQVELVTLVVARFSLWMVEFTFDCIDGNGTLTGIGVVVGEVMGVFGACVDGEG
jgi:hypothetical protein